MGLSNTNVKYWELAHPSHKLGYKKESDYSARCDICGDSQKSKSQKRLHLYTKSSFTNDAVGCFNCGYSGNMYSYLRDHHPELLNGYRAEMGFKSIESLTSNILEIQEVHHNNTLLTFNVPKGLVPAKDSQKAVEYLKSRCIDDINSYYYCEQKVTANNKDITLSNYIVTPLLEHGKWFGFYSRSIDKKVFHTYLPEENTGYKVWNWFNINKQDPVYIFEAIFNAQSTELSNIIAVLGSDIDEARLKELKTPIFCFDNDTTGKKKALKYASKGYSVSLMPSQLTKDPNDLLRDGDYSKEEISNMIVNGVCTGFMALVKLKM